jgi:hypothetical protein
MRPTRASRTRRPRALPRSTAMNLLGLEQADYSLRQRVVVRVAGAAHGGFDTGLGPEFEAKRLELLKAALPKARRVAVLASRSGWDGAHGQRIRTARSWVWCCSTRTAGPTTTPTRARGVVVAARIGTRPAKETCWSPGNSHTKPREATTTVASCASSPDPLPSVRPDRPRRSSRSSGTCPGWGGPRRRERR